MVHEGQIHRRRRIPPSAPQSARAPTLCQEAGVPTMREIGGSVYVVIYYTNQRVCDNCARSEQVLTSLLSNGSAPRLGQNVLWPANINSPIRCLGNQIRTGSAQ